MYFVSKKILIPPNKTIFSRFNDFVQNLLYIKYLQNAFLKNNVLHYDGLLIVYYDVNIFGSIDCNITNFLYF